MDGSAATSFAERTRSQISRAFANRSTNEACAQSELFEQLLNLKFTAQPPPEKQPSSPDAAPQSTSANGDKKDVPKADEEKDDEPAVTVAALPQAVPLPVEKPIELKSDQPAGETKQVDTTQKPTELVANQAQKQAAANAVDSGSDKPLAVNSNDQAVAAKSDTADAKVEIPNSVTAASHLDSNATEKISKDLVGKKVDPNAAQVADATTNQPQEVADATETQPVESSAANVPQEIAVEPKPASGQNDDRDDRRGDRREKWFEHKDEAIGATQFERPEDSSGSNATQIDADAVKAQSSDTSSQQLTVGAQTPVVPPVDPTLTVPVALPATLSIAPQTSTLSGSSTVSASTATSSSSSEPTPAVTSAPSRPVGNQTAKANAKDKATEPGLSQQERVRVIQRIARSFNRISSDGGSINLRLHPEHLGSVSVQVRLEGRSLSARMSTETTAARDAIMQDLPALRQRLADQGFDVTKFQVDVAGNGADASFAQSGGQSQFGQAEDRSGGAQTDYRRVAAMRESRAATTRQLAPVTNLNWQSSAGIDLQA